MAPKVSATGSSLLSRSSYSIPEVSGSCSALYFPTSFQVKASGHMSAYWPGTGSLSKQSHPTLSKLALLP